MPGGMQRIADALNQRGTQTQQGGTYYPVQPLGPYEGPTGTPGAAAVASNPGTGTGTPGQFNMGRGGADWMASHTPMPGTTLISALPQQRQDRMNQMWSLIGGGAAMPTTLGDFRTARQTYHQAHPGQWPAGWPGMGRHRDMMGQ